jgi:hypothetical protein
VASDFPTIRTSLNPNFTDATNPVPNAVLYADLEGVRLGLPWWTSVRGAIFDLLITLKTIPFDWEGIEHDRLAKMPFLKMLNTAWHVVEQAYMLVQAFAGFAHLGMNGRLRDMVRFAGPGVYSLLLASTAKQWIGMVVNHLFALFAAWLTALSGLAVFLLLSLPPTNEAPLYQLWSPWCVIDQPYGNQCANSTSLELLQRTLVPKS